MRLRRLSDRLWPATLILTAIFAFSVQTLSQQNESDPKRAAEVEQAIRDFYKAFVQGDHSAVDGFIIDQGFNYAADYHASSGTVVKAQLNQSMDAMKMGSQYSFELSNFTYAFFGSDVAATNYRLAMKSLTDPNDVTMEQVTDTLVRRNGKWRILAEHTSPVRKPLEPIIAGLPIGWQRTPESFADRYTISVDTVAKHSGQASASLKHTCGDVDDNTWAGLGQAIAAEEYRGKRVRLTAWLKTLDAGSALLWMRIDGDRHVLAFDNMINRLVTGTTDWKMYSLVLDVPAEAKNIWIGASLIGRGQSWVDDFKLEVVDDSVASTNSLSTEEAKEYQPTLAKNSKETNKHPINLGFEDGAVH